MWNYYIESCFIIGQAIANSHLYKCCSCLWFIIEIAWCNAYGHCTLDYYLFRRFYYNHC